MKETDLLRIYLQSGSFYLEGTLSPVEIAASLIATTFNPPDKTKRVWQGKLIPKGKSVVIFGNLIVDYLFTEGDKDDPPEYSVPEGGYVKVIHDPAFFADPDSCPWVYRVSIGQVRNMYSMNAGGPTL